ncbi:MAG: hypothetical protein GY696_22455, partial [Gammaproteobacteria bacterium]|nr:hypothetical protein [Gammaproteobacteria bacterium]
LLPLSAYTSEVLDQLVLEVEEEIGSEDEAAFTQVIKEDEAMNNIGQLH